MSSHAEEANTTRADIGVPRRRWRTRSLGVFLMMSIVVHAAVIGALPAFPPDRSITPVRVLEVALVQAEAPPQVVEPPEPPPPQTARRPQQRIAKAPSQKPAREPEMPAPVLALPQPREAVEPQFTVPAAKQAEVRTPSSESRTDVANVTISPPNFGAAYLRNPAPAYPPAAKRNNVQGTVTLRVLVTREGLPGRVELEKSSGSSQLDEVALETVKSWRFVPARRGADPVEDTVIVPIVFRLERQSG
jgi:periplasmic protein TonB